MKVCNEISLVKLIKFAVFELFISFYKLLIFPPSRKIFLRIFGAKIGKEAIINETSFVNLHRLGFKGLKIGKKCFIGSQCMFDLADKIILKDDVTLAERVLILTHLNVGYKDHPLQKDFPSHAKPVIIEQGCFIGAGTIILAGIRIGQNSFIGAGSLVNKDVPDNCLVAGKPIKIIKKLNLEDVKIAQ